MRAKPRFGSQGPPRRRRWPLVLLAILGVFAAAFYLFQTQVVEPQLRPLIEKQLTQAVHSPVAIGSVRAGLLGDVVLNNVSLTVPGSPWESRLTVDQVSVEVELYNLLFHKKPIEQCLDSLSFIRPRIILAKSAAPPPAPGAPATVSTPSMVAPIPIFPVPKTSIRDGSFAVQSGETIQEVFQQLKFDASTQNGTVWGLSLLARSPGKNNPGSIRFDGDFQADGLKVKGTAKLQQWPLASLGPVLKGATGWDLTAGTIDIETPIGFQAGQPLSFNGQATLNQVSLKTPGPVFISFTNISGVALLKPSEISIPQEVHFQLGQSPFTAKGIIPLDGRPLAVESSSEKLYLATVLNDILKLNQFKVAGSGSADLVVSGPLTAPVVTGSAEMGNSKVNQWPLDSLAIKGSFKNQLLSFDSAKGKLLGGSFTGNGFSSILDRPDAPVSLRVTLKDVDAKQIATILGVSQTEGKINQELRFGGTRTNFLSSLSSIGEMDLTRTLRGSEIHYLIRNKAEFKNQKLVVSATLNDKSKLEAVFLEEPNDWKLEKFIATAGNKTVQMLGHGILPKAEDQPVQIEITGRHLALEDLPIFNDQFPDISGSVDLDAKVVGTRKVLAASTHLSGEASLGDQEPSPLELSLSWKQGEGFFNFDKLEVGKQFSVSGKLAYYPETPNDLRITADQIPVQTVAEIAGLNNPPQPFEGSITGHLHLSGVGGNPVVEGDDILVKGLQVGDWAADKVTAALDMDNGRLVVKKLTLEQGKHFLSITGNWDTRPQQGAMALRLSANSFQLAKGPYLNGDFSVDARTTGEPFWRNWDGTLASKAFTLTDLKGKTYAFSDFSMPTSCENMVFKSRVKEGTALTGSAIWDASTPVHTIQALLKIGPGPLGGMPEITQFLPEGFKVTGNASGEIKLKKGTFDEMPLSGSLVVTNGTIPQYDFDRAQLDFDGDKKKISATATLMRDQAKFSLSGGLESPHAFWDSESKINIHGPMENVKLQDVLTLLGSSLEKHRVGGNLNGDFSVSGLLFDPTLGFSVEGEDLLYDNFIVPKAELHFSYADRKITLQQNRIKLQKGQITVDSGTASWDPQDPSVADLNLSGSAQELPIGIFNFTNQIRLSGKLALEEKKDRPTFDGLVSVLETDPATKKTSSFDVSLRVHHKLIEFLPSDNDNPQLVGEVDLSQSQKVAFNKLHLENTEGTFSVDGNLDFNGPCSLVSDSKNIPIQELEKWFLPNFPLKGTGSYHLVLEGTLDDPVFTASLSVMDGQVGDLSFDLLSGELKSSNNTLFLGDEENPITLSKKDLFTFTLGGKLPFALTREGRLKVRNNEMDITAKMDKGDFGLVMMTGWPKKASGNMDFSAHVGGTLDNPDLTLDLDLAKCTLVPPMVAQSIDDLNGRIKVRHNKLAVEDLNGRIGQGRVFITSPPVDESKMTLVDFVPDYLDFRVQTIGTHGLWLSIPTIMRKGEWGEIYFYGTTPNDKMVIQGPLASPIVSGTALLDTGHYTFPPEEAYDEHGQKIEFRELAGVKFDLTLESGKNTWYSNDFNSNYLELKVDPNEKIIIQGRDADSTPEKRGIECSGTVSSSEGWLSYLSHRFVMENGWINISRGKAPTIWGRATDRLTNVDVVSAGGVRKMDVDIWVDFKGTFGAIDFKLSSSPLFDPTDPDKQQKLLLSYIMFNRDMTGYTTQQLQQYYQQNYGQTVTDAISDAFNRFALNEATRSIRSYAQQFLGSDVQLSGNPINLSGTQPGASTAPTTGGAPPEAYGNTLTTTLIQAELTKPLDKRLQLKGNIGLNRGVTGDLSPEGLVGMDYLINPNLKASAYYGQNEYGQQEGRFGLDYHATFQLPGSNAPKQGDVERPNFERFDIYPTGPGKFSLKWTTDKFTKCEVKVFDMDGQIIRDLPEKKNFDYYHDMMIEGLAPDQDYKVQITAKDLNGNERIEVQKASASFE